MRKCGRVLYDTYRRMKSFVLYYSNNYNASTSSEELRGNEQAKQTRCNPFELHINLWKIKNGVLRVKSDLVFDFGVKFDSEIAKLCLFLPFKVSRTIPVKDLGEGMSRNRDLLNAVFNEDMICQSSTNHCFSRIEKNDSPTDESKNEMFYIYHLGASNVVREDYKEGSEVKGTYLKININGAPSNKENSKSGEKYYIRFRIYVEDVNEVVHTKILSNDLLQAAFSRTDLYDIRLNEKREIPSKVDEKMNNEGYALCKFSKIHFFYIADTDETINNGIDIRKDSRLLEKDQWMGYEPQCNIEGINYIAHHWKKDREKSFSHFSLFFSTIYPKVSSIRLLAYLTVVVLLSWLGSMLSFSIIELFKFGIWVDWICPILIVILVLFLLIYIFKSNFVLYWLKLKRKL